MKSQNCQGHPAGPNDPMGQTVFCDGSCAKPKPEWRHFATGETKDEFIKRMTSSGALTIIKLPRAVKHEG